MGPENAFSLNYQEDRPLILGGLFACVCWWSDRDMFGPSASVTPYCQSFSHVRAANAASTPF